MDTSTTTSSSSSSTASLSSSSSTSSSAPSSSPCQCVRFLSHRVIVTGGASGIGRECVKQFVREGAIVAIFDIDQVNGMKLQEQYPQQVVFYKVDVSDCSSVESATQHFAGAEGRIHHLINGAAFFGAKGLNSTPDDFSRSWSVNVSGYASCVRAAHPFLKKTRGSIVNIASCSGHRPQVQHWTYSSTKGGILTMTKCMALDLAKDGIRVNSVSPAWIWSPEVDKAAQGDRAKWEPIWGSFHMLNRCGDVEEVARPILFLCSSDASFITSTDLAIDGGYMQMSPERFGEQSMFAGSTA